MTGAGKPTLPTPRTHRASSSLCPCFYPLASCSVTRNVTRLQQGFSRMVYSVCLCSKKQKTSLCHALVSYGQTMMLGSIETTSCDEKAGERESSSAQAVEESGPASRTKLPVRHDRGGMSRAPNHMTVTGTPQAPLDTQTCRAWWVLQVPMMTGKCTAARIGTRRLCLCLVGVYSSVSLPVRACCV